MPSNDTFNFSITTNYQGHGIDQAIAAQKQLADSLGKTAQAQDAAGQSSRQFVEGSSRSAASIGTLINLAKGGQVSIMGVTTALRQLWVMLVSNPFTVVIGLMGALIGVFVNMAQKSRDAREKMAADMDALAAKNAETAAKLEQENLAKHFEEATRSIEQTVAAYARLNSAAQENFAIEQKRADIKLAGQLAALDAREADEIKQAEGSPVRQTEIRARYAGERTRLQQGREVEKIQEQQQLEQTTALNKRSEAHYLRQADENVQKEAQEAREKLDALKSDLATLLEALSKVEMKDGKGLRSEEQKQLDRLEELRSKPYGEMGLRELEELDGLRRGEAGLREKAATAPTFGEQERKTLRGLSAVGSDESPARNLLDLGFGAADSNGKGTAPTVVSDMEKSTKSIEEKAATSRVATAEKLAKIDSDAETAEKKATLSKEQLAVLVSQQTNAMREQEKEQKKQLDQAKKQQALTQLSAQMTAAKTALDKLPEGDARRERQQLAIAEIEKKQLHAQAWTGETLSPEAQQELAAKLAAVDATTKLKNDEARKSAQKKTLEALPEDERETAEAQQRAAQQVGNTVASTMEQRNLPADAQERIRDAVEKATAKLQNPQSGAGGDAVTRALIDIMTKELSKAPGITQAQYDDDRSRIWEAVRHLQRLSDERNREWVRNNRR